MLSTHPVPDNGRRHTEIARVFFLKKFCQEVHHLPNVFVFDVQKILMLSKEKRREFSAGSIAAIYCVWPTSNQVMKWHTILKWHTIALVPVEDI